MAFLRAALGGDGGKPTGMGIDQPCGNGGARQQIHPGSGVGAEAVAERRAGMHDLPADPGKSVLDLILQTDLPEIGFVPAVLMGQIGPFACQRA